MQVRATRSPQQVDAFVAKLRVYSISDQDDAGPWIRREFPELHYIALPSTPDGDQYYQATWTGISGDRFYKNAPGADFTTFTDDWVNTNIRGKGPLGKLYPFPCCIHEGDTPSFLGLIDNGLDSAMSPTYGGWGGRYVWRRFYGEPRPNWTQGGDSYPGSDNSRDTVIGSTAKHTPRTRPPIWRWRTAFQHDFAARMDWTIRDVAHANHNPDVVVNGQRGQSADHARRRRVGHAADARRRGSRDPDGNTLTYTWFVLLRSRDGHSRAPGGLGSGGAGWRRRQRRGRRRIPSAPRGGPPEPPARVILCRTRTRLARDADAAGTRDRRTSSSPSKTTASRRSTSYRRVILTAR